MLCSLSLPLLGSRAVNAKTRNSRLPIVGVTMNEHFRLKAYRFTPQELQMARAQVRETKDTIGRLRNFLKETTYVAGDAIALQRASALKTIHHLESQIDDWVQCYPHLQC